MAGTEPDHRMVSADCGVLTMAYGAPRYYEMAKSLARSLAVHSPTVPRAIITDRADEELRSLFHTCVPLNTTFGFGNRQKLHLDVYTPFDRTLFIDGDCLVVRDIADVWGYFRTLPFGIPGEVRLHRGAHDPKMDVDYILERFHLKEVPKFNSGLIYFDRSDQARAIFDTARQLLSRYRELRFARPEKPFDEPVFAVAMAIHGLSVVADQGRTMRTPTGARGRIEIDVLRGIGTFDKYGTVVEPAIIHFAGASSTSFEYQRECFRLRHIDGATGTVRRAVGLTWIRMSASFSALLRAIRRHGRLRSRASSITKRLTGAPGL